MRTLPEVTLRAGRIDELEVIASFWLAMFEEVGKHRESEMLPDWRARFVAYFERRITAGEARFFVATEGGAIVATAGAAISDGYPGVIHGIHRGYIFGVRVAPPHRRAGLAKRLTEQAVAFLRDANVAPIRLHASRFGRGIYEGLGFTPTNEMELP
jgi:ribosomal protein S18 acetylase RimI-like enzyme